MLTASLEALEACRDVRSLTDVAVATSVPNGPVLPPCSSPTATKATLPVAEALSASTADIVAA